MACADGLRLAGHWTPPPAGVAASPEADANGCQLLLPWTDLGEPHTKAVPDEPSMVLLTLSDCWFLQLHGAWPALADAFQICPGLTLPGGCAHRHGNGLELGRLVPNGRPHPHSLPGQEHCRGHPGDGTVRATTGCPPHTERCGRRLPGVGTHRAQPGATAGGGRRCVGTVQSMRVLRSVVHAPLTHSSRWGRHTGGRGRPSETKTKARTWCRRGERTCTLDGRAGVCHAVCVGRRSCNVCPLRKTACTQAACQRSQGRDGAGHCECAHRLRSSRRGQPGPAARGPGGRGTATAAVGSSLATITGRGPASNGAKCPLPTFSGRVVAQNRPRPSRASTASTRLRPQPSAPFATPTPYRTVRAKGLHGGTTGRIRSDGCVTLQPASPPPSAATVRASAVRRLPRTGVRDRRPPLPVGPQCAGRLGPLDHFDHAAHRPLWVLPRRQAINRPGRHVLIFTLIRAAVGPACTGQGLWLPAVVLVT